MQLICRSSQKISYGIEFIDHSFENLFGKTADFIDFKKDCHSLIKVAKGVACAACMAFALLAKIGIALVKLPFDIVASFESESCMKKKFARELEIFIRRVVKDWIDVEAQEAFWQFSYHYEKGRLESTKGVWKDIGVDYNNVFKDIDFVGLRKFEFFAMIPDPKNEGVRKGARKGVRKGARRGIRINSDDRSVHCYTDVTNNKVLNELTPPVNLADIVDPETGTFSI